ncbi:unnamed protein product [Cylindrotheca closterium]|uniref:Uncharacterized protein n=1 Tax=Cylindrotheca closterium TaxID=2856 RepID=A0AAD2FIN6_9STRA|nr:unnamed protein product [Cylindrotheca closterium]CAJ1939785.1 unnamed protein product [Cylindrotheca closterium]
MAGIKANSFPGSTAVAVQKKANKRGMEPSCLDLHKAKRPKQTKKEKNERHVKNMPTIQTSEEYGIILKHVCLALEMEKKQKTDAPISVKQFAATYLKEAPIDSKIKSIALGIVGNWTELLPLQSPESQIIEL